MSHDLPAIRSPELRLLYQRSDSVAVEGVRAQIDWPRLFEMAEQANAFPVIWRRISRMKDAGIPPELAQRVQRRSMVAEFSLLNQGRLLEKALGTLTSAGVEVVLLKGAGLAASVYASFANRPMGDLDLLVRPHDASRARDALVSDGWVWPRDSGLDAFYEKHCHLAPLFDASRTGATIELHIDIFAKGHPFGFGADAVWRDRRPVLVGGQTAWIPSAQHQLLHAVIHFAWSHAMLSGAWNTFRDVDALAAAGAIDWDEFVELAGSARAGSCAYWSLALARGLGAAEVPDAVLRRLEVPMTSVARGLIARHIVAGVAASASRCPSRALQRRAWDLAIRPEESGHGAARPWMHDEHYTPTLGAGVGSEQGSEGTAVARSWRRYLRALVRPR